MLAAATSSRPAVTRRAYECGGVDVDGDGIVRQSAERERGGGTFNTLGPRAWRRARPRRESVSSLSQ